MPTRILFMGTPEFALPTLKMLIQHYAIVAVITQPDRPAGRGRTLQSPPVKAAALLNDLTVFQPPSLRNPDAIGRLRDWAPDLIITVATGHILTREVLAIPTQGTINVHASLLPRWRGAAPIQAALLAGDKQTGITIMCTDEGLDTGPILSQHAIPIAFRETASALHDKLAQLGADLLEHTLPRWLAGELSPQPQGNAGITIAPRIHKTDGLIDWTSSADEIDRRVRAYDAWPGAYTLFEQKRIKVIQTFPFPTTAPAFSDQERSRFPSEPATIAESESSLVVITGRGVLRIDKVQPAGKRAMSGKEFLQGRPDIVGARLG